MVRVLVCLLVAGLAFVVVPAGGAPIATLTFVAPTGSAAATDSIEVWLRLTLDSASDAIITDASGNVTSGYTIADVVAGLNPGLPPGVDPTVDSLSGVVNIYFSCSGTFTASCTTGPPYDFAWNFAPPTLIWPVNLNVQPGTSTDFLFGTFTPTGGSAPAGTYTFFDAGAFITVADDTFGHIGIAEIAIANTGAAGIPFTRDVTGAGNVPEPATSLLIPAGIALLAGLLRRRIR
jgi:hypothetical protein